MSRTWRTLLIALLCVIGPSCGDDSGPASSDGVVEETSDSPLAGLGPTGIHFTDVSAASGITEPNHSGRLGVKEYMIEACGIGPAWFDYDNDGFLDVYIPDGDVPDNYDLLHEKDPETGRTRPILQQKDPLPEQFFDQLWRNNGDGTFTNVAAKAQIHDTRWSFGATAVDYDADGWTDIFLANFGENRLWKNNGDGTFTDVAPSLGLTGWRGAWNNCAAAGDIDGDGRLDLYVTAFAAPAVEVERQRVRQGIKLGTPVKEITGRSCVWKKMKVYCGPRGLARLHDTFYRQGEDGTFEDMTKAYGLVPRRPEYGFTPLMFDFDDDGLLDIYLANDSVPNFMWQQSRDEEGRPRFEDVAEALACRVSTNLLEQASMGTTAADVNQDGAFDIYVTNFAMDYNNLFLGGWVMSGSKYLFRDRGLPLMGQEIFYDLCWGCGFYDFDNDADLDLYVACGHVYKEVDLTPDSGQSYYMLNALFECIDPAHPLYREVGAKAQQNAPPEVDRADLEAGDGMAVSRCSRAAAFADFDNDGRLDVLVCNMNDPPTLLRNTSPAGPDTNWIKIELRQPGGNRTALGATVEVTAGGVTQRFPISILNKSSFLSTHDPRLHVGLGKAQTCDVRVIWPGQARASSTWKGLAAGHLWHLHRDGDRVEKVAMPQFQGAR